MPQSHLPQSSTLNELIDNPALRPTLRGRKSAPLSAALAARLLALPERESVRSDEQNPSYVLGPPHEPSHLGSLGDYDVIALRGTGGMAFVFEGFDRTLTRHVAIKLLNPDRSTAANRERFLREAQAAAGLRHDHLLPVFGTGQAPDGTPYFAMPLLESSSLRDLMNSGTCLTPRQSAEIALHIADALAAAHAANLIHRDVKPENILIDPLDGRAKLTDFGLVRAIDRDASSSSESGLLLGTPEYMAPEQWENPETADARCDVYSLGITLYEMLTGQTPYRGHPHLISQQVLELEPTPPRRLNSQLPRDLEAICLKAIGKEPAGRYATTREFRDDLRRWLENRPILARPAGRWERLWKAARRKPALAGLAVALVLAVMGGFAGVTWMWKRAESNAAIAVSNEQQARLQLARAEEHRAIAKEAVDKFYRDIYEKGLLNDPNLTVQKREIVGDALRFYERMLVQELEDPQLIRSAAETAVMIGLLTRDVQEVSISIPHFKRAVELARNAVSADPTDVARKLLLLRSLNHLAVTWNSLGDLLKSEECGQECVTIWSELVQEFPANVPYRRNLTAMQVNLASLAYRRGDRSAAKAGYSAALEQFQIIGASMESQTVAQLDLGRIEYNLSLVSDSLEETVGWVEKSRSHRANALRQDPNHALARRDFVMSSAVLARDYLLIPEKKTLALDVISEGVREARIALNSGPDNLEFHSQLLTSLQTAGVVAHELGRDEEADSYFDEEDPLVSTLLEKDRARFRLDVSSLLAERFEIRLLRKQSAQAEQDRQLALQLIDELLPTLMERDPLREAVAATRRKLVEQ